MEGGSTSRKPGSRYIATSGETEYRVGVEADGAVTLDGQPRDAHLEDIDGAGLFSLLVGARSYEVFVEAGAGEYAVTVDGQRFRVRVAGEQPARPHARGEPRAAAAPAVRSAGSQAGAVMSPMTGVLVELLVTEGQEVKAGDGVAILEAMKTRNVIRAPRDGVVRNVQVAVGQTIRMDHAILVVEARAG